MIQIGIESGGNPLQLTLNDLLRHMLICGATGSGKSKLLETIFRQVVNSAIGWTLLDLKGHTADDTMAWLSEERSRLSPFRLRKLVYLDPERGFFLDPFETTRTGRDYRRWLSARIDTMKLVMIRMDGTVSYAEMPRKSRWTTNTLWVCAARRGHKTHFGLPKALDFLDIGGPAWQRLFESVEPFIPEFVARDWRLIRALPFRDRMYLIESTINGFRRLLSTEETVEMFSGRGPSLDLSSLMHAGAIIIGRFGKTAWFSDEAAVVVSNLILSEELNVAQTEKLALPHLIAIEEVAKMAGPDLSDMLLRARAFKVPLILLQNSINSFRTEKVDLRPDALSECGITVSLQQKNPEDIEILAKSFGVPNLNFEPLHHIVDRQNGYQICEIPETSTSRSNQQSLAVGENESDTWNASRAVSTGRAAGHSRSVGGNRGHSNSTGAVTTRSAGHSIGAGGNETDTEGATDGSTVVAGRNKGTSDQFYPDGKRSSNTEGSTNSLTSSRQLTSSKARGKTWQDTANENASIALSRSQGNSHGCNWSEGDNEVFSRNESEGFSVGGSKGRSLVRGQSDGNSETLHNKRVPLPLYVREHEETGRLRYAVTDQLNFVGNVLSRLPIRFCLIRIGSGRTKLLRIDDVSEAFEGRPLLRQEAVAHFKRWIYSNHGFYMPEESAEPCRKPKGATEHFRNEDGKSSDGPTTS